MAAARRTAACGRRGGSSSPEAAAWAGQPASAAQEAVAQRRRGLLRQVATALWAVTDGERRTLRPCRRGQGHVQWLALRKLAARPWRASGKV